jgi:hypothetical protein
VAETRADHTRILAQTPIFSELTEAELGYLVERVAQRRSVVEIPVFDGGPYPASGAAVDNATQLFIGKQDFQGLCLAPSTGGAQSPSDGGRAPAAAGRIFGASGAHVATEAWKGRPR